MRLTRLYLRSRGLPQDLLALVALTVLAWWAATWLPGYFPAAPGDPRLPVVVLIPLLAAVVISTGLTSPSPVLDLTVPLPWWRWRVVHVLGALTVSGGLLGGVLTSEVGSYVNSYDSSVMIRNLIGFLGMACLAAAAVGAHLSWTVPMGYGIAVYFVVAALDVALPDEQVPQGLARIWYWQMQPAGEDISWLVALCLLIAGVGFVSIRASRHET